jgi:transposase
MADGGVAFLSGEILVAAGQSYREISHRLGISKNTVLGIVKRDRAHDARAA